MSGMKYNRLGKTGLLVSELSYGTWVNFPIVIKNDNKDNNNNIDDPSSLKLFNLMKTAYINGVNTFDTAEAYGKDGAAEILLGKALKIGLKQKLWDREDLVIITKIFFGGEGLKNNDYSKTVNKTGLSMKHIIEGLKLSLKRMDINYVDVVMAHRPDPITPIEEIVVSK
jgi:aryl-alcohol dehydrogenase-like predicted oxidoreductase